MRADALRVEYLAITDAGFILQIDDPGMAENWDAMDPSVTLEEYRAYARLCIEALNHALAGIPEDRVRYHMCWGSWHGPHLTDIPLRDIVDLLLTIRAGAYSLEAGNVRHEHEWKVWQDVKLPAGTLDGGELRTASLYRFGTVRARLRVANAPTSLTAFFVDKAPDYQSEIDIEIFNDTTRRIMFTTYSGAARRAGEAA